MPQRCSIRAHSSRWDGSGAYVEGGAVTSTIPVSEGIGYRFSDRGVAAVGDSLLACATFLDTETITKRAAILAVGADGALTSTEITLEGTMLDRTCEIIATPDGLLAVYAEEGPGLIVGAVGLNTDGTLRTAPTRVGPGHGSSPSSSYAAVGGEIWGLTELTKEVRVFRFDPATSTELPPYQLKLPADADMFGLGVGLVVHDDAAYASFAPTPGLAPRQLRLQRLVVP